MAIPQVDPDCEVITRIEVDTNLPDFPENCTEEVRGQIEQHVMRGVKSGKLDTIGGECAAKDGRVSCRFMLDEFPVSTKDGTAFNVRGVIVDIKGLRFLSEVKVMPKATEEPPLPAPVEVGA